MSTHVLYPGAEAFVVDSIRHCSLQGHSSRFAAAELFWPYWPLTYIEVPCISDSAMELGKDLLAASATPLVLAILAEGDRYGYAVIKHVGELSGRHRQWT